MYIKSSSSYSLHSMHTKKSPTDYADSHRFLFSQEHLWISVESAGEHSYPAWKVIFHWLRRLTQIFVTKEHLWISVESAGEHSYAAWKVISHRLRRLTQIFVTQEHLNICEICGRTFICCLRSIRPLITQTNTDFCYSRTSVNICGICGRTIICCLSSIRPQITQINTDFSFLKNICEYLWDLWENIHMLLER